MVSTWACVWITDPIRWQQNFTINELFSKCKWILTSTKRKLKFSFESTCIIDYFKHTEQGKHLGHYYKHIQSW